MSSVVSIPTRGRITKQVALQRMSPTWRSRTFLFCPQEEVRLHKNRWDEHGVTVVAQPDPLMTIARKRAWILEWLAEQGYERTLMLDDDLIYYVRRDDVPDRLRYAVDADLDLWFPRLFEKLTHDEPHAGFGPRQGNDKQPTGWVQGARMMLALGYHIPTVLARAEHGRIETREDMDICLQLLSQGLPNSVTHEFCVGQGSYAASGGCEGQRTVETSDADAQRLADFHPGYVRVVQKEYKNVPRKEVICYWKRALEDGAQRRKAAESGLA